MPRDLYLARDIVALDIIAKQSVEQTKNMKLPHAYKAAEKLHPYLDSNPEDEEKTYIHITRYLFMLNYIYKHEKDEQYFKLMYDSTRKNLTQRHNELKTNLINRYKVYTQPATPRIIQDDEIIPTAKKPDVNIFGPDKYITCQQLYEARNMQETLLIMDIRSRAQFENSQLKIFTVINIDEKLVKPGLSAHKLGETLPNDVKEVYDGRSNYEYIVLLDLDTSQDNYLTSKLRTLYVILTEWDINTIYKRTPHILKGGYIDFVDRYPTYSTNPRIILQQKYEELDELLDLDNVQYPDELTSMKEDSNRMNTEMNALYKEIIDISLKLLEYERQILDKQKKFYDPANASMKKVIETDIAHLTSDKLSLNSKRRNLNCKLQSLLEKSPLDDIQKKVEIRDIDLKIVNISREGRKLMEAHRNVREEAAAIPNNVLGGASASSATDIIGDSATVHVSPGAHKPDVPVINRSTKPKSISRSENLGLVGLTNIRNTCYMNSIIQCFRHLPSIKRYFLNGTFEQQITTPNPTLIFELGDLIRKLWTTNNKSICPNDFYKRVTSLNPVYRHGNHEDANEFFMFIYDHIFEDTAFQVKRDRYAEAKYQTLYDRLQYKDSFFVKEFYHQIRTDCVCGGCRKKCLKYDIENVLMMGVPAKGSCSIEELYDEFMHTCDISDYYCRKCERKGDIFREFSFQPKVIAFLLKRYTYGRGIAEKITVPCDFPTDNFRMGRATYKLWAVSLHQGGMDAGHYTAVCLNSEDGNWYEFNDELVRPANIHSRSIKEKIYMLFYESEDGSDVGFSEIK